MHIKLPEYSLILLVAPVVEVKKQLGQHIFDKEVLLFWETHMVLSDFMEKVEENLSLGKSVVVEISFFNSNEIKEILEIGDQYHYSLFGFVVLIPDGEYNQQPDRHQLKVFKSKLDSLFIFFSMKELQALHIERTLYPFNKKEETGPFDIIGDVHGCFPELMILLKKLGYRVIKNALGNYEMKHAQNRKVIFVGDLVDRGPDSPSVLKLTMSTVEQGTAFAIIGNHDDKLMRKLQGRAVQVRHGLETTIAQMEKETKAFERKARKFLEDLPAQLVLDRGKLIVAHAGLKEEMHGKLSKIVREFALYGETDGTYDENGLPNRTDWADNYHGDAIVVYGHTPVYTPEWKNNTIGIDTGCVYGGSLTALRYPEMELVSVDALKAYAESSRVNYGRI